MEALALDLLFISFFVVETWSQRVRRIEHVEGPDVLWNAYT